MPSPQLGPAASPFHFLRPGPERWTTTHHPVVPWPVAKPENELQSAGYFLFFMFFWMFSLSAFACIRILCGKKHQIQLIQLQLLQSFTIFPDVSVQWWLLGFLRRSPSPQGFHLALSGRTLDLVWSNWAWEAIVIQQKGWNPWNSCNPQNQHQIHAQNAKLKTDWAKKISGWLPLALPPPKCSRCHPGCCPEEINDRDWCASDFQLVKISEAPWSSNITCQQNKSIFCPFFELLCKNPLSVEIFFTEKSRDFCRFPSFSALHNATAAARTSRSWEAQIFHPRG